MRSLFLVLSVVVAIVATTGSGQSNDQPAILSTGNIDSGTVRIDGFNMPYLTEGSGRPCIFVGIRNRHSRTLSARFKSQVRCTFVDTRAYIPTAVAQRDTPYSVEAAVGDIEAVRRALHIPKLVIMGNSIGGTIAIAYARRYPDRVSQVIAICPPLESSPVVDSLTEAYWKLNASSGRKAVYKRSQAALTQDSLKKLSSRDAFIASIVSEAAQRWYDSTYDESWLWPGVEFNSPLANQLYSNYSLLKDSSQIQPPVFLALGRHDYVCPLTVWERHRQLFRDVTINIFERSGHTPQLEEAEKFDAAVLGWLSTTDKSR